jgi:hypothetical protein
VLELSSERETRENEEMLRKEAEEAREKAEAEEAWEKAEAEEAMEKAEAEAEEAREKAEAEEAREKAEAEEAREKAEAEAEEARKNAEAEAQRAQQEMAAMQHNHPLQLQEGENAEAETEGVARGELCPHCARTFSPGRLEVHLRSCRPGNAARKISESTRKTKDTGIAMGGTVEVNVENVEAKRGLLRMTAAQQQRQRKKSPASETKAWRSTVSSVSSCTDHRLANDAVRTTEVTQGLQRASAIQKLQRKKAPLSSEGHNSPESNADHTLATEENWAYTVPSYRAQMTAALGYPSQVGTAR